MNILVVDDHPMVRKGIISTLKSTEQVKEIKEVSNLSDALKLIEFFKPDIIIIDLNLGKEDGLELVHLIRARNIDCRFVVLTSSFKRSDFLRAQEAGVEGYILKEAFPEDIIYGINVVTRGKKYYDPEIVQQHTKKVNTSIEELTQREKDVLTELGKGLSNVQIAKNLYISEHTVKKHVSNIFSKLSLNHRTEAVVYVNKAMYNEYY